MLRCSLLSGGLFFCCLCGSCGRGLAGALFALLCFAKHLFLTLAPVLAAVFIAAHVRPRNDWVKAFLELAGASIAALALGLAPLLVPEVATSWYERPALAGPRSGSGEEAVWLATRF